MYVDSSTYQDADLEKETNAGDKIDEDGKYI